MQNEDLTLDQLTRLAASIVRRIISKQNGREKKNGK